MDAEEEDFKSPENQIYEGKYAESDAKLVMIAEMSQRNEMTNSAHSSQHEVSKMKLSHNQ